MNKLNKPTFRRVVRAARLASEKALPQASCYASGEIPMRGDWVKVEDNLKPVYLRANHPENDETWIVTKICDDMLRAKCERAPLWRQAFYTRKMLLVKRADSTTPKKRNNQTHL